jgi:hypothetical protein
MESPLAPVMAKIYMEHFEQQAMILAVKSQSFGSGSWMIRSWCGHTERMSYKTLKEMVIKHPLVLDHS